MNLLPFGAAGAARWLGLIVTIVMGAAVSAAAEWPAQRGLLLVQTVPDAGGRATTGNAPDLQGIGLTASHRRIIYENVADERTQTVASEQRPAVGATLPDSVMLTEMPIAVKDQVGLLRDFKFAKLPGDHILIVDPASRKIVDIVTREDGGRR